MITKFKDLITSVDVINTLHGGVSQPLVSMKEQSGGQEMHVRVPGVDREALRVEVHNNELSVFYFIPIVSSGTMIQMPQVVYKQLIPYFIEISGIKAGYEENELIIQLPYNKLSEGYNKKIEID